MEGAEEGVRDHKGDEGEGGIRRGRAHSTTIFTDLSQRFAAAPSNSCSSHMHAQGA